MKKFLILILGLLAMTAGTAVYATPSAQHEEAEQDSTITIIGKFNKGDTIIYNYQEVSWQIMGTDTIMTESDIIKMRINVLDETADGYKMEYSHFDLPTDTLSAANFGINRFQEYLGYKFCGNTTVYFETNKEGHITKIENLKQILEDTQSLFDEVIKEYYEIPEIKEFTDMGIPLKLTASNVDIKLLIDDHISTPDILFKFLGRPLKIGEYTEHHEATDSENEYILNRAVVQNPDNGYYLILNEVTNFIPGKNLKTDFTGTYVDYIKLILLPNGWPYASIRQVTIDNGQHQVVNQTIISPITYHFVE